MSDGKNSQPKAPANSSGGSLEYVAEHWDRLPPHICEAIVTLVDAAIAATFSNKQIYYRKDDEG